MFDEIKTTIERSLRSVFKNSTELYYSRIMFDTNQTSLQADRNSITIDSQELLGDFNSSPSLFVSS